MKRIIIAVALVMGICVQSVHGMESFAAHNVRNRISFKTRMCQTINILACLGIGLISTKVLYSWLNPNESEKYDCVCVLDGYGQTCYDPPYFQDYKSVSMNWIEGMQKFGYRCACVPLDQCEKQGL
jgi:hypothetical protein